MRQLLSSRGVAMVAIVVAMVGSASSAAVARDFFSSFFGGLLGGSPAPSIPLPYAAELGDAPTQAAPARPARSASAYCVRTCDGRYFPLPSNGQSRAETCRSFCPASETKVVYGGDIDRATTETGKPYSELPNAFRYRNELVAGCTCNGKDSGGLAKIDIRNDPTVRKGDLVAGANGLVAADSSSTRRGTTVSYSPVSKSARARFEHLPVVAAQ